MCNLPHCPVGNFASGSGALTLHEYPNLFIEARKINRQFIMHVGPTNSGKTYEAYEALAKAETGAYLAPLRLLALEGRDTLASKGLAVSLVTGEEQDWIINGTHRSSTIEMADLTTPIDVAIIDEFQMLYDDARGWAWTNAICGMPAKVIYLCGSPEAIPAVKRLIGLLGDSLEIRRFERKNTLEMEGFTTFRKGDAVIAFSRRDVINIRSSLKEFGFKVSTIYGALSPEVRRSEAERFIKGTTDIIVSTDAIGMGLNLPVERIVFCETSKYDGQTFRKLTTSEIMQIAGRAGRFGFHEKGLVATVDPRDVRLVEQAMGVDIPKELFQKISVSPTLAHVEFISNGLQTKSIRDILDFFSSKVIINSDLFQVSKLSDQLVWAGIIDSKAGKLSLADKLTYCHIPLNKNEDEAWFEVLLKQHLNNDLVVLPDAEKFAKNDSTLNRLTAMSRLVTAYIWLSFKYPKVYCEKQVAEDRRTKISKEIEHYLVTTSQNKIVSPKMIELKKHLIHRTCTNCNGRLPLNTPYSERYCYNCRF